MRSNEKGKLLTVGEVKSLRAGDLVWLEIYSLDFNKFKKDGKDGVDIISYWESGKICTHDGYEINMPSNIPDDVLFESVQDGDFLISIYTVRYFFPL